MLIGSIVSVMEYALVEIIGDVKLILLFLSLFPPLPTFFVNIHTTKSTFICSYFVLNAEKILLVEICDNYKLLQHLYHFTIGPFIS